VARGVRTDSCWVLTQRVLCSSAAGGGGGSKEVPHLAESPTLWVSSLFPTPP
jgi:hypothetical protein